jgi:hypothetical protein
MNKMKVGGSEMPIKFSINQTDEFCELRDISLKQYYELLAGFESGNYRFKDIRGLIWSALKEGARIEGVPFEYDEYQIGEFMDEDPARYITEALKHLVETLPKPTDNGTAKKKKAPARNYKT